VALALVSKLLIGSWCLLCIATWLVAAALFASAWRACRDLGVAASVREDLAVLRDHPRPTAGALLALAGVIAVAAAAYPRYWEARAARAGGGLAETGGSRVVVEYSDYECPYCARAHEETRALLVARPDVTLVHRNFPLDPACNPLVKKAIHPGACEAARAGICGEELGRGAEMADALFRNQADRLPPEKLAERLGIDLRQFSECLSSPGTERRLAEDVASGARDGVRATPTYLVGKAVRVGQFPVDLLPPKK
jgi:hypothetical protein